MREPSEIVPLRFFIGGREVTHANWHKLGPEVTEERLDAIAFSIYDAIGTLRCATHGKKAKLEGHGESLRDIQFRVIACCEGFRMEVKTALESIRPTI